MPTIAEACSILHVSHPTLKKFLDLLKIKPTKHHLDGRFYTITDEDVHKVADLLAERPEQKATPRYVSRAPHSAHVTDQTEIAEPPESHLVAFLVQHSDDLPDSKRGLRGLDCRAAWRTKSNLRTRLAQICLAGKASRMRSRVCAVGEGGRIGRRRQNKRLSGRQGTCAAPVSPDCCVDHRHTLKQERSPGHHVRLRRPTTRGHPGLSDTGSAGSHL